ncbi:iron-sulfur cluster repair di-iron protein [Candidatus Binatia bacterium]|jgi:regulator of cell morphogenesis and NO signaling|nr:iron-sulfur cluster repair di-iron protein [Candidatus Binatia bacterium]
MLTLSEIATRHPAGSRVLHRHGLDFCCGGRRSFGDACAERGLAADAILAEIEREDAGAPSQGWDQRPLGELVEQIVGFYHRRLREELPLLVAMASRVENRHGDKPECPRGLSDHLAGMHEAVLEHLAKEERILFPLILSGRGAQAGAPIHVMEVEHEDHRASLLEIRRLTGGLVPPPPACTTWRALYLRLSDFERELMEHVHLENNVLFTRALLS